MKKKNIKNCLEIVKWADGLIIVDMYNEDGVVEICKKYTNRIFFLKKCDYCRSCKAICTWKLSHEWVLFVDTDERVPIKLKNKLFEIDKNYIADMFYWYS